MPAHAAGQRSCKGPRGDTSCRLVYCSRSHRARPTWKTSSATRVTGEGSFRSTTGFTPTGSLHTGRPARPRPRGSRTPPNSPHRCSRRTWPSAVRTASPGAIGSDSPVRPTMPGPAERSKATGAATATERRRAVTTAAMCSSAWGRSSLGRADGVRRRAATASSGRATGARTSYSSSATCGPGSTAQLPACGRRSVSSLGRCSVPR